MKIPAKTYLVKAEIAGASEGDARSGGRDLAPAIESEGVLWPGDKIAILPQYTCGSEQTGCYTEIDQLERALESAGFLVEPWRRAIVPDDVSSLDNAKELGLEYVFFADAHALSANPNMALEVTGVDVFQQTESAEPQKLELEDAEWDKAGPRCMAYLANELPKIPRAPSASMTLRLVSVAHERVMWVRKFKHQGAVQAPTLNVYHKVPTRMQDRKPQRYWGLGLAGAGVGVGLASGLAFRGSSPGAGMFMLGAALISAGIGGWLVYDSRPREVQAREPAEILCAEPYMTAVNPLVERKTRSAHFSGSSAGGGDPADLASLSRAGALKIDAELVNEVARSVATLQRSRWEKPKKKKDKKDDKKKQEDPDKDRVSALSCRWEQHELRCRAACTRCSDPWEGPCEICRPPLSDKGKAIPVPPAARPGTGVAKADKEEPAAAKQQPKASETTQAKPTKAQGRPGAEKAKERKARAPTAEKAAKDSQAQAPAGEKDAQPAQKGEPSEGEKADKREANAPTQEGKSEAKPPQEGKGTGEDAGQDKSDKSPRLPHADESALGAPADPEQDAPDTSKDAKDQGAKPKEEPSKQESGQDGQSAKTQNKEKKKKKQTKEKKKASKRKAKASKKRKKKRKAAEAEDKDASASDESDNASVDGENASYDKDDAA